MVKRQMKTPKRNDQLLTINKYIYKINSVFTSHATIKKKKGCESFNIETFYFNQLVL